MNILPSVGRNVYIDKKLVGYIASNSKGDTEIYISGRLFAHITDDGIITIGGQKIGEVADGGDIYLRSRLVGEVDANNDFRFYGGLLSH